jgi:Tfp pilus assembly protein PilN
MVSVNLLPGEIAQRQSASRRVRGWTLLVLLAIGAASVPVGINLTRRTQASGLARRCDAVEKTRTDLKRELVETVRAAEALDRELARSETLRTKRCWSSLLQFVTGCLPEDVWLTSLSTPQAERGRAPRRAEDAGRGQKTRDGRVVLDAPTSLTLAGYAADHEHLYTFMSRLKQAAVFGRVDLLGAGVEPALAGHAVRFELECSW